MFSIKFIEIIGKVYSVSCVLICKIVQSDLRDGLSICEMWLYIVICEMVVYIYVYIVCEMWLYRFICEMVCVYTYMYARSHILQYRFIRTV